MQAAGQLHCRFSWMAKNQEDLEPQLHGSNETPDFIPAPSILFS